MLARTWRTCRPRWRHGSGCWGTGRSDKNDPSDALSVAIAALRTPGLRQVRPTDHTEVLRVPVRRNIDIGNHRTRVVCRLHNALMALAPRGIARELNASDVVALLEGIEPGTPVEQARHDLAAELLADLQRLDAQLKQTHRRIRLAVNASGTSLTDLFGVGPVIACHLIAFTVDASRFANRDQFAAYNDTAPVERSSGGQVVHRLSQRGNHRLNPRPAPRRRLPHPPPALRGPGPTSTASSLRTDRGFMAASVNRGGIPGRGRAMTSAKRSRSATTAVRKRLVAPRG